MSTKTDFIDIRTTLCRCHRHFNIIGALPNNGPPSGLQPQSSQQSAKVADSNSDQWHLLNLGETAHEQSAELF
jgi:hypothetical protein